MKASALRKSDPGYAIVTQEILNSLLDRRILMADLLSHSTNIREHHAGWAVRETLVALKKELEGMMA